MLSRIKIEGFKSLESVEIELGRINVFIGANGSGKSNLLEALGVLGAAASGRVDDESLLRRGVRPGLPGLYKSSFKKAKKANQIRFLAASESDACYSVGLFNPMSKPEPAWRFVTESLGDKIGQVAGRSPRTKLRLDAALGYAALKVVEALAERPASCLLSLLQNYAIFSPDTPTLRGLDIDPQTREPLGLNGGRLAEAVEEVFRHAGTVEKREEIFSEAMKLIGWASVLGSTGPGSVPVSKSIPQPAKILRFRDRYMAEGRDMLSGFDASEGALYVLFLMCIVHHPESPGVLAIDNFDHALNPRLATALTRQLCQWVQSAKKQQLLLTSHNPMVLDGLPLQNDDVRLFTVQRSSAGRTVVSRVRVDDSLLKSAEEGVPLSQQWVMGSFGGLPRDL